MWALSQIHRSRDRRTPATHRQTILFFAIVSLYSSHELHRANALSIPGKKRALFRKMQKTDSELVGLVQDDFFIIDPSRDDAHDQLFDSPAASSSLFPSPIYPKKSSKRQYVDLHRRRLLLRSSRLNYKDNDDDDDVVSLLEERKQFGERFVSSLGSLKRYPRKLKKKDQLIEAQTNDDMDVTAVLPSEDITQEIESTIVLEEGSSEQPRTTLSSLGKGYRRKSKSSMAAPTIVTNVHELREAILDRGLELRDVELKYSIPPSLMSSKKQQDLDIAEHALKILNDRGADMSNAELIEDGKVQVVMLTQEPSSIDNGVEGVEDDLTNWHHSIGDETENWETLNEKEWQLIGNVLAEDEPPSSTFDCVNATSEASSLFPHEVLNLLHQRYHSQSTPLARAENDTHILALSIEGGGMRGAVSGGMAAAICCLGLCDAFDSIYGSSAGSIIGSYFVSRQLYLDVYTDVIPAGKTQFVRKGKIIGDIFRNMFNVMKGPLIERFRNPASGTNFTTPPPTRTGGLNISFVLDTIMCPENGLRPLDLESFSHNDEAQPLRIVSSAVELDTGRLKTVCFGSKEGHFRDSFANHATNVTATDPASDFTNLYPELESAQADKNGHRRGLWACLAASMTVPGAAGCPTRVNLPSSDNGELVPHLCFDAFCYEPVPFRSAVAEGATHVLALRSRPAAYQPKTKPTLYERAVAPLYFKSHGVNTVAEFFERGGQQYMYAEDVLTLDEGLDSKEAVKIPPADVLYASPNPKDVGGDSSDASTLQKKNRDNWAQAHLLPITVPADVPELAVLSQDRDDILAGMRSGFAAAYDMLAPVVGLDISPDSLDGMRVAELVFPDINNPSSDESVMGNQFELPGEKLVKGSITLNKSSDISFLSVNTLTTDTTADLPPALGRSARFKKWISSKSSFKSWRRRGQSSLGDESDSNDYAANGDGIKEGSPSPITAPTNVSRHLVKDAAMLLSVLPGIQLGSLPLVIERLQNHLAGNATSK